MEKMESISKTYYLHAVNVKWLEQKAAKENRSVSNFLDTLIQKSKDADHD